MYVNHSRATLGLCDNQIMFPRMVNLFKGGGGHAIRTASRGPLVAWILISCLLHIQKLYFHFWKKQMIDIELHV